MSHGARRERDITTGPRGLRLRLCEWGPTTGRPVLILHGYLEQGAAWHDVATHMPGRRVVAPDHRGHGLSEHVGAGGFYHFWDYVADVQAIVRDLDQEVDLVGHSMGGTVACLFAACRPDRVRRLVLIEGLGPPDRSHAAANQAKTFLRHRADPPQQPVMKDVAEAVQRMCRVVPSLPQRSARRMAERCTRPVEGGVQWTWDPMHRERSPQPFSAALFGKYLSEITAPVRLIDGATSPWLPMVPDLEQRRSQLHSVDRVLLDGHGHHPHHTCPELLAARILEHFNV